MLPTMISFLLPYRNQHRFCEKKNRYKTQNQKEEEEKLIYSEPLTNSNGT